MSIDGLGAAGVDYIIPTSRTAAVNLPRSSEPTGFTRAIVDAPQGAPHGPLVRASVPGVMAALFADQLTPDRENIMEIFPGRYANTVSLPGLLRQVGSSEAAKPLIDHVLEQVRALGVEPDPELVKTVREDPAAVVNLLAVSPGELSGAMDMMVARYRAGQLEGGGEKARLIQFQDGAPHTFDFGGADSVPFKREVPEWKAIIDDVLWMGDIKSALSDADAKANTILAEVFDRLGENGSATTDAERFGVNYGQETHWDLESFLSALEKTGHTIEVSWEHRAANFTNFKTLGPGNVALDVPAGLMMKTGLVDERGDPAVLPSIHAEMIIKVRGPDVQGDVKFFQGMSATGFFPCGLMKEPEWCGRVVAPNTLSGDRAIESIALAGYLSDAINDTARALKLPYAGYGVTGVCMDSVAIIRHAMTGEIAYWPLLMRDQTLMPEVQRRLADKNQKDDDQFGRLLRSIDAVPSDIAGGALSLARIDDSICWAQGREPFFSIATTRRAIARAR